MAKITRSARGELVDFDLVRIKEQMSAAEPVDITIKARENFIDRRLRRRSKEALANAAALLNKSPIEADTSVSAPEAQGGMIDQPSEAPVVQRAKKKPSDSE